MTGALLLNCRFIDSLMGYTEFTRQTASEGQGMFRFLKNIAISTILTAIGGGMALAETPGSVSGNISTPEAQYQQYCALCHGADRAGYANDDAPSLNTKSMFAVSVLPPYMAAYYGRPGTTMGPYGEDMGGPLSSDELHQIMMWLSREAGVPPGRPPANALDPIVGDVEQGEALYQENCAMCHGGEGEGHGPEAPGTALGNATMLATSPDLFLKIAISEGREGTQMPAFKDMLTEDEINSITAFLRSRASGWDVETASYDAPPSLENIVLNPEGEAPEFELDRGRYISAEQLNEALSEGRKMVLIDTRVPYFWAMAHIKGSLPVPYYSERSEFLTNIPNDGTWVVAYCECPRAAADATVSTLRELGYENTAVLYEGYAGWTAKGFPISVGKVE